MREIEVNGERLLLDPAGVLLWPAHRILVFADLHFEKGSAFARNGQMLPPYDTRATLARMERLVAHYAPVLVIALGDSFHDRGAADRLENYERDLLAHLGKSAEWVWITGNHDPAPPSWLSGSVEEQIKIDGLLFRHEPSHSHARGEIAGHLHPCKSIVRRGRSLRRRCFVSDGLRLVMPAFGAYAGGLDVRDVSVRSLFGADFLAYMLGTRRVYAVAA